MKDAKCGVGSVCGKVIGHLQEVSAWYHCQQARVVQLEFINGEIWANVWMTECIARIDPRDGKVRSVMIQ